MADSSLSIEIRGATPTCEHLLSPMPVRFCGKVAVWRYPDTGGGFMHVCLEHAKAHEAYAEPCYDGERA